MEPDKQNKPATPNGSHAPAPAPIAPEEPPAIVQLSEVDVMRALLFDAHRKRLEVELQNIGLQEQAYSLQIAKRYGIDMSKYVIDAELKIAKRKEQP